MDVLLVRHAIAEERDFDRWPDDRGRPLTREGTRKFRAVAQVLARCWETPDLVLASPLARTWQTAQLLEEECRWPEPEECPALEPAKKPSEILAMLKKRAEAETVVLVGHEPSLQGILSHFVAGAAEGLPVEMKKGGAALVRFDGNVRAGGAKLLWLVPPRLLLAAGSD
jgi:phosphohistidine phosphatase SixA